MMRNVAMKQEVASESLTKTRSTLSLEIKNFGRPNNFNINSV
jgi:hypothetical protein